ncbi:uncharacterized protein LOC125008541 [Mugil cephalus]|uniref:uncharacterized protein LOC125008541 n=1 Tax=Mugil cephalus TaxID=48193 RepID=UPI001FB6AEFB|nr:uncharacterized protein LOC125008541 [Mugil cephalus]
MALLWVTLLLVHQAYALVPLTTVQLGEPAILTCTLPEGEIGSRALHWYKQSSGDTLKLIAVLRRNAKPSTSSAETASRMEVKLNEKFSNLTILKTIQEDEGMYHCAVMDWTDSTWSGTYLSLKGNRGQRTSNYTVVQTVSDPVRPGDSVTLQCSVLSDSEDKTCPGNLSVFWFRAGSQTSHPNIIYTDGDMSNKCENRSETQKRCVYSFSKDVSSSDAGTYYCAVATCGEILFGNGAKLTIEETGGFTAIALVTAIICLAISVILNIVLICCQTRSKCGPSEDNSCSSNGRQDKLSQPVNDNTEDELNYAALHFSGAKATRGRKKKELKTDDCVYSQVTCRMCILIYVNLPPCHILQSLKKQEVSSQPQDQNEMVVLWITLLCLHPVYTLTAVKTVQLGQPATFTCVVPDNFSGLQIYWYKQHPGDTLNIIATSWSSTAPQFAPGLNLRFDLRTDNSFTNLTILRTVEEDEGMYHCGIAEVLNTKWSGTYLLVEGNTERTIVQTVLNPVRPGDSVTLQCSVLSDSENKTCPGNLSVFWFRAGSQTSHPNIIYTDVDMSNACEKRSETQKRCVYSFSKDVSSSDAGTYYCAVATCGEILFGNGAKLEIDQTESSEFIVLVIAIICLAISVFINIAFICYRTPRGVCGQYEESSSSPARRDDLSQAVNYDTEGELSYAALHFSGGKPTRGRKKRHMKTEENVL